ncbi:MAG: FctA domain-containing protein [Lachnospiraceae bacterium]
MNRVWKRGTKSTVFAVMLICLLACIFAMRVSAANDSATVSLLVEQMFTKTGTDIDARGIFDYILTPNQVGCPMPAGSTAEQYEFTLEGGESRNLEDLVFTSEGTYEYTLKQVVGTEKGYHYDTTVYTIWIQVININGKLVAQTLLPIGDGSKHEKIIFNNGYQPEQTDPKLMSDPPVKKIVKGSPSSTSEFIFTLVAKDVAFPMPEESANGKKVIKIVGEGEKEFGPWSYTAVGNYYYTISEEKTDIKGYTYDKTVYTITDIVTDKNGQLVLNRSVTNGKESVSVCTFTNQYTESGIGGNSNNASPYKSNGVKTGDTTNLWLWLGLIGCSIVLLLAVVLYLHNKRKK